MRILFFISVTAISLYVYQNRDQVDLDWEDLVSMGLDWKERVEAFFPLCNQIGQKEIIDGDLNLTAIYPALQKKEGDDPFFLCATRGSFDSKSQGDRDPKLFFPVCNTMWELSAGYLYFWPTLEPLSLNSGSGGFFSIKRSLGHDGWDFGVFSDAAISGGGSKKMNLAEGSIFLEKEIDSRGGWLFYPSIGVAAILGDLFMENQKSESWGVGPQLGFFLKKEGPGLLFAKAGGYGSLYCGSASGKYLPHGQSNTIPSIDLMGGVGLCRLEKTYEIEALVSIAGGYRFSLFEFIPSNKRKLDDLNMGYFAVTVSLGIIV